MKKYLFIILGLISLGLGLLGIVTPGLPTTPFILLTGVLFAKSSPRLHQKLLDHKITGPYIRRVNNGFSTKGLIISISIMWTMIILTTLFKSNQTMQLVMVGLGFVGTVSQIIVLRKRKKKEKVLLTLDNEEKDNNKLKAS